MNKIILTLFFTFFSSFSFAANTIEECDSYSSFARLSMELRQKPELTRDIVKNKISTPYVSLNEVIQELIDLAYQEPLYEEEEHKDMAILSFKNRAIQRCISGKHTPLFKR